MTSRQGTMLKEARSRTVSWHNRNFDDAERAAMALVVEPSERDRVPFSVGAELPPELLCLRRGQAFRQIGAVLAPAGAGFEAMTSGLCDVAFLVNCDELDVVEQRSIM